MNTQSKIESSHPGENTSLTENQNIYTTAQTASILLMVTFVYINGFATPALAAIAAAFPTVDIAAIQQVVALPSLTSIVGSFLAAVLAKFMNRKHLFILCMFLVLFTGVLPGFIESFELLIVCKALIGVGTGMSLSLSLAFVPALFNSEQMRSRIFGWGTSVGAVTGVFVQLFGGFLATFGWNYPFFGSLITIPIIIFIWRVLPDPSKVNPQASEVPASEDMIVQPAADTPADKKGFSSRTYALLVLGTIAPVFFFSFMTNMALAIAGEGLGDPAISGTVLALYMVATAVNGVLTPYIKGFLKGYYFTTAFLLLGIALVILAFVPMLPVYYLAAVIFGLGFGMYNVEFGVRLSESCSAASVTTAMSLFTGLGGLGQFLSPFILAPLTAALGMLEPVAQWEIAGPCLIVVTVVVFLVQKLVLGKKHTA